MIGEDESYEICFVPDNNYRNFLRNRVDDIDKKVGNGNFIDEEGNEVVENHIHDIMFENGKIKTIFVYSKPAPSAESEE